MTGSDKVAAHSPISTLKTIIIVVSVVGGVFFIGCVLLIVSFFVMKKGDDLYMFKEMRTYIKKPILPKTKEITDIQVTELLGDGNFGQVWKGIWQVRKII